MYSKRKVSLYAARYYPLVGGSRKNSDYRPMIPGSNVQEIRKNHEMYLQEVITGNYRLCAVHSLPDTDTPLIIRCPVCGRAMKPIRGISQNQYQGFVYICPECKKEKGR